MRIFAAKRSVVSIGLLLLAAAWSIPAFAKESKEKEAKIPEKPERTLQMDYGPFLSSSLVHGKPKAAKSSSKKPGPAGDPETMVASNLDVIAYKGINIRVGPEAAVCFDTDTLAMAAGWTGGFLDLSGTMLTNHKGTGYIAPKGDETFRCAGPGWAKGDDFTDPRPQHIGQLPLDRRYKGLYVYGDKVVLSYRIGGNDVLETPGVETVNGVTALTRTIRIEKTDGEWSLALFDVQNSTGSGSESSASSGATPSSLVTLETGDTCVAAMVIAMPKGASVHTAGGRARICLQPVTAPAVFKVAYWNGPKADLAKFKALAQASAAPVDPKPLCTGGPARWTKEVTTTETLGDATAPRDAAYIADSLGVPENNPWNSWMRTSGFDFLPDGRIAVCTLNGDVWLVSGFEVGAMPASPGPVGATPASPGSVAPMPASPARAAAPKPTITWKRFATGLYQPLGLRVIDGKILVCGRDQITRLHDLNGDDEADFYEDFNSGSACHPVYHAFAMELQSDAQGNVYYARCGRHIPDGFPDHGDVFKISPDGQKIEAIATGLRACNGMGVGPDGTVLASDNEGEWTPSSRIDLIPPGRAGQFFGYMPLHNRSTPPTDYDKPLCWIPHELDPSSGGEAYIPDDRWGPLKGNWVHTSFGAASLFLLLTDEVDGQAQGAVVKFPVTFATGIMRARFNPKDGQLYVCGLGGGWQTRGTADGAIYRVRYTGKPVNMPNGFHVEPHGVRLTFPNPLDKATAGDDQNWAAECWNYKWAATYGSPDLSVKNPGKAGHDDLDIKSATLSDDGKSVTLAMPTLGPVMQLKIEGQFKAGNSEVKTEIYGTVNKMK